MTNDGREKLAVGMLVRLPRDGKPDEYGVVTEADHRRVCVRWDTDGLPNQFTQDSVLERVDLTNKRVIRVSTGDTGMAMSPIASGGQPMWRCFIVPNFGETSILESDLRLPPITEPVERFQKDLVGSLKKYRLREVTQWYLWQHMHNDLVSLGNVRVDIKPHQVGVVHKVVSNYPHRFLLCDEVGLGKTIEAGMALKELRSRGVAQRVLIIVPPNLVRQWQHEMKTKFNETFAILNTATVRYEENRGNRGNPFALYDNVLCSSSWVANRNWADLCEKADWDLIIVDEAHHARRHQDGTTTTRLFDLVCNLADYSARRSLFFLTATPMQLGAHEIYALVELLDPVLFPSQQDFEDHRRSVSGLNRLVERLRSPGFSTSGDDFDETVRRVSAWLEMDEDDARQRLSAGQDELDTLADDLSDRHLLSEVMIRNRKSVVGGFMPRVANRWKVELTQEELDAIAALEEYVQYGFNLAKGTGGNAIGFVMVTFQKLMASSIAAIKNSLNGRKERIRDRRFEQQSESELAERLDDDDNAADVVGDVDSRAVDEEILLIDKTIDALERVRIDSKSAVLLEQLMKLRADDSNQKVLIFTQFRETQKDLENLLGDNGWEVNLFHGQMRAAAKDRAVERFRDNVGAQVLISTEAGGEGRNLQFCHTLVNYDLPWNPMRVEQRIGRVDRIGQEKEVKIFNLWVKDTIEDQVLDVLENRIRVFEETVGGLDPILGKTENDLSEIMRLSAGARESALQDLGTRLESQVKDARQAEEQLADFIMDTKSYSREIAERIAEQPSPIGNKDAERFMGQLLSDVRTYIKPRRRAYELTFGGEFVDDHPELFAGGNKLSAVFRPDSHHVDSEHIELMAFGNPIVDAIVERVTGDSYDGVTGTRRILAGDGISPTSGWLFTYLFNVPDMRSFEYIVHVFVSDSGEIDIELGQRIMERACRFDESEQEIEPGDIPVDKLIELKPIVEEFVSGKRDSLQAEASERAAGQADQEKARLTKYFDYRDDVARDKLGDFKDTLKRQREELVGVQRNILSVSEANVRNAEAVLAALLEERNRRMAEAEKLRHPAVDYSIKSLGRIEVVEEMGM